MGEQSSFEAKSAGPGGSGADGHGEVGQLALGERTFIIALSAAIPHPSQFTEMSRFQILGCNLVVLEATRRAADGAGAAADPGDRELASRLTGRELEIAVLVARGYATKNIAYRLQISEWTVATYLRRIFAKLGVYSRAQMVYRCAPLIDRIGEIRPPACISAPPPMSPPAQESKVGQTPGGRRRLVEEGARQGRRGAALGRR
jgi:DNA-binding CsgD family transcriptional regulator